jgi:gliding motility-associated-like protein
MFQELTQYPSGGSQHPVFYYSNMGVAQLVVMPEGGSSPYTFTWNRYNQATGNWDIMVKTESGTSSDLVSFGEGGYQVTVSDNFGYSRVYRAWAFEPRVENVSATLVTNTCVQLIMNATSQVKPLQYYDPVTKLPVFVNYGITYQWGSSPAGSAATKTGATLNMAAPVEDADYWVTAFSRIGVNVESARLNVKAVAVQAAFKMERTDREVSNEKDTEAGGSAPVRITFIDESKGPVASHTWSFGEAGKAYDPKPTFVFLQPGTYTVTLEVTGSEPNACQSVSEPQTVVVKESELLVPNVFTPNGDGANDEFRVAYRSLRKFHIVVVNRWGRKVYESSNPAEGWDGTIGGKEAAPGVYFYVATGQGYIETETHKKEGFVHLIRGSK